MRETPSRNSQMRPLVFLLRGVLHPGREYAGCVTTASSASSKPLGMEKQWGADPQTETMAGGLKQLVMKWFTETQAPLIQNNGNFPDWFQGFATRKETEDLLRDKALGCFLIRLSDKAIGYILSYKGHDRCRHFVITQNRDGQFIITGDCQPYHSLTELIEHYKVSPIQPFGEHLTRSCYEADSDELYDVVHCKGKTGVSVQALRSQWNQHKGHYGDPVAHPSILQHQHSPPVETPSLPPKKQATNRKLMGSVSVDTTSLSQSVPPVPKRGFPPSFFLSGSLPETSTHPNETNLRGLKNPLRMPDRNSLSTSDAPDFSLSELLQVESRSKSLTQLDNNKVEEEYSNQLSGTSFTTSKSCSPTLVTCHTYSLHKPGSLNTSCPSLEQQSDDLKMLTANPLYQTSEGPGQGSGQQRMYADIPQGSTPAGLPDNTYELIPGESTGSVQTNTYESLDEMKKPKSTWGKSNIKWKFLPDYKKK